MKLTIDDVRSRFKKHFDGTTGSVYASPGRINLIGEHTDYNNGFCFPWRSATRHDSLKSNPTARALFALTLST